MSVAAARIVVPTQISVTALPVLSYAPLAASTAVGGLRYPGGAALSTELGFHANELQITWTAFGGFWALRFTEAGRISKIEDWLESGLGRHIELYSPTAELIWEGYVSKVTANIGGLSITRGPLLDTVANRVRVIYSTVDTSTSPPTVGVRAATDWAEDTTSQGKYGIIERVVSVAGSTQTVAEQIRNLVLEESAEPETAEVDNVMSAGTPSATIECQGYVHWLKAFTYNSTTTGTQDADAKLQAVLAQDPNEIFSTDDFYIDSNTTAVKAYDDDDRVAMDVVKGIVALGDNSGNRWLYGLYANRRSRYTTVPTDVAYQRRVFDTEQRLETFGSNARVMPWRARPGEWVFYTDLLAGRTPPSERRLDPRYLLIEQVTYTMPWGLTMQGAKVGRLDQLLAQMGLGGSSA